MTSQVLNGDSVILNYSNFVLSGNTDIDNTLLFRTSDNPYNDGTKLTINKLSWSYTENNQACNTGITSTSCGTMSALPAGVPIYYGDLIILNYSNNTVSVGTDNSYDEIKLYYNNPVIENCSKGLDVTQNFTICDNKNYTNTIWCVVNVQGLGYLGGSDHVQKITDIPLSYGTTFFLQSFAASVCSPQNKNKYFVCNTNKPINSNNYQQYRADIGSIANQYPNSQDSPGYNFVLFPYCSYSNNCIDKVCNPDAELCPTPLCQPPLISNTLIKSGQYICFYSSQSALPVAISGDSNHTLGFNDTGSVSPGENAMTFLIKKINIQDNSFYSESDINSSINVGDPFVLFGKTSDGKNGLVYTAGNYSYPGGYNNILINNNVQVYNSTEDCSSGGSAYATWCFVSLNGTGNVSGDDPNLKQNTGIPVYFGQSYIIQNFGKGACNLAFINAVKNFPQYVSNYIESNDFWKQDGNFLQYNTPNLNLTSMSSPYPVNNSEFYFYCTTYLGGISYTSDMNVNTCINCNSDECSEAKGCCGCDTVKNISTLTSNIFDWVFPIIFIIIAIVIVVVIVIFIILFIKSLNNDPKESK